MKMDIDLINPIIRKLKEKAEVLGIPENLWSVRVDLYFDNSFCIEYYHRDKPGEGAKTFSFLYQSSSKEILFTSSETSKA